MVAGVLEGFLNPTKTCSSEETEPGHPGMGALIRNWRLLRQLGSSSATVVDEVHPEVLMALDVMPLQVCL